MNPIISVIVPVYNTESYLRCCINSILAQTFTDFELLLVDDGSTDQSGVICDEYARQDSRVRVFHKSNSGVSSARNVGLENAIGKWIAFVDSDDHIKCNYLEYLLLKTNAEGVDLVISFPEVILIKGIFPINRYSDYLITSDKFENGFASYDFQEHTSPWGKLYRAQIINEHKIRFNEEMCFGEDTVFFYTFLFYVNSIYVSSQIGYCYRGEIEGSLSKRINPLEREYTNYMNVHNIVDKLIERRHITDYHVLSKLKFLIATYIWRTLNSVYHYPTHRKERLRIISSLDISSLTCKESVSMKEKALVFLLCHQLFKLYDMVRIFRIKNLVH